MKFKMRENFATSNPDPATRIKMIEEYGRKNTRSVAAATRALQRAGILDKNGKLSKRYRAK